MARAQTLTTSIPTAQSWYKNSTGDSFDRTLYGPNTSCQ